MEENLIEEVKKPETNMRERRLWFFRCTVCGKSRRRSHNKARAKEGVCLSCFRRAPNPNQPNLHCDVEIDECFQCDRGRVEKVTSKTI